MAVREAASMATGFLRAGHLAVLPAEPGKSPGHRDAS